MDEVIYIDNEDLNEYSPLHYLEALSQFLSTNEYDLVFFGHTYEKKDDDFEKIPDISSNIKDYDIASWELNPGDLITLDENSYI